MASSAPDRLTPRAREIVTAAREVLESEGLAALTMRNVAARLGIRAPSLYKHFPDKDALEAAIISDGFVEMAEEFEEAGTTAPRRWSTWRRPTGRSPVPTRTCTG